jgi:small-conductance mechanosensitive channel
MVIGDMKLPLLIILACLLAMATTAEAQNNLDAAAGSLQEQINAAGQQLQEKAVQHALEGNLTQEHITQELNATKEDLTNQATEKIVQISQNLTSEGLQQKAAEQLKTQVSEQIKKQPGFEVSMGILASLAAFGLLRRRC